MENVGSGALSRRNPQNHQFRSQLNREACRYVICYWNGSGAQSGGTSAEITVALRKGIPVYLVTTLPPEQVSGWMLGCCERAFSSIEDLKEFLLLRYSRSDSVSAG